MNNLAIITEHLTRDFPAVRAVDDLSISVPEGFIFGFLGPNGSGKTTTIRLLLGLLEPTHGSARVLGLDVHTHADQVRERCGALLEHHGLYERLTAVDNLEFYGRVWRIPSSERRARIKELLSQLDLWERREEITGQWSRGMKQKLAIARTLLHRPRLVFMDEPTAGLDPIAAAALRNDLALLTQREGVMIFLTTHNLDEAEKLCHHLAVIRQGRLLAFGSPDELRRQESGHQVEILGQGFISESLLALKNQPSVSKVQLDDHRLIIELTRDTETAPLVSLLVSAGAQVEEVHKSKVSLEEVFLALMAEETAESITR